MRIQILALASLVLLATSTPARSQNLVPNPSFESYSTCPNSFDQLDRCNNWVNPNASSPDYFHACSTVSFADVPNNAWGSQGGYSGSSAYVACVLYRATSVFREYVQVKLTSPLVASQTYNVAFRVSLADKSSWEIADIGAHLSATQVTSTGGGILGVTPQIFNPPTNILSDATGWTTISGTYTATGGEEWLTLGNFKDNAGTNAQARSGTIIYGLYYFDGVVVEKATPGGNLGGVVATPHIIGWSDLPSPATTGYLDIQDVDNACKPAKTICRTLQPIRATTPYAGGTAYDSRYQTAWVSDGVQLAEQYVDGSTKACRSRCPTIKATIANPNASVSGLAVADRRQQLFQLATYPGYYEIVTYDNRKCPVAISKCTGTLPANTVAAGLAYDEVHDLLYWTISTSTAIGYTNVLLVSRASNPCVTICKVPVDVCSANLVTGIGYDACSKKLYLTDGQLVRTLTAVDPVNCKFLVGACCKKQQTPIYRGLAVVPGWTKTTAGASCMNAPCPSCPSMHIDCVGDPALGARFGIRLEDAPAGGFATLFIKVGPCGTGIPLPPPFCGSFFAAPWILAFPTTPILGFGTCTGSAENGLRIPPNPALCGGTLCAQWWIFCLQQNQFGFGFSDAMEFKITGS